MAVKAFGTQLQYRESGAYIVLGRVISIKPPTISAKDIDITTLESPDEFEELMAGLASGGELEATVEYDKDKTEDVYALFRVPAEWRVRYPGNSGWTYAGFINEYGDEEVVNGEKVTQKLKVRVTGKPEFSAALAAS